MTFIQKPLYWIQLGILFFCYFITGKFGLAIGAVSGFATLIWFPTGISLVALLHYGYRMWPAIFLGAFLVNFLTDAPFPAALGMGAGNTLEAIVSCYLLRRFVNFKPTLERLRDVTGLALFAGPIGALVSATLGVLSLFLSGIVPPKAIAATWLAWWTGDVLSIMIVAPFLLTWMAHPHIKVQNVKRVLEALALLVFLIFSTIFIFINPVRITYFVFPAIIWVALRFGQRETASAVFLITSLAVVLTAYGIGPFVRESLSQSLLYLQSFMSVVAVTSMILAAIVLETRQLDKRKDQFINLASHELRTPITSIKIYLHIVMNRLKKQEPQEAKIILSNVDGQIMQLKELISDLLDISRIQAGKLQFSMSKFSVDQVIGDVQKELQPMTKKHTIIYEKDLPFLVHGDRERIKQVLINLVSNAIKYSPNGGDILVKVRKKNTKVIIGVQDFGIGLSKENQKKIFEHLYQDTDTKEQKFPGLGIGLYIAKEIIKRHREKIWVESDLSKGSTFYFSLGLVRK